MKILDACCMFGWNRMQEIGMYSEAKASDTYLCMTA